MIVSPWPADRKLQSEMSSPKQKLKSCAGTSRASVVRVSRTSTAKLTRNARSKESQRPRQFSGWCQRGRSCTDGSGDDWLGKGKSEGPASPCKYSTLTRSPRRSVFAKATPPEFAEASVRIRGTGRRWLHSSLFLDPRKSSVAV